MSQFWEIRITENETGVSEVANKQNYFDKINNKIPNSVKELLDLGGNFVTFVTPTVTIIGMIIAWATGKLSSDNSWKNITIFILSVIIIILFYRFMRQRAEHKKEVEKLQDTYKNKLQAAADARQKERSIASQKYYQLMHDYRNVINDLECSYKNGKLTDEALTATVKGFLENALDYLVETLNEMTGQKVSGCVKAIIGGNSNRISYEDAKVNTFVRSHNTVPARKSLDIRDEQGVLLCGNTDFMDIIAEDRNRNDSVFYQPNLKEYDQQLKAVGKVYKNTTPHWEQYYIGTIVAPIRIASKRLFYLDNEKKGQTRRRNKKNVSVYYTLGFLCVDSLSADAFTWEQKENYTYIVKAYASTMFNIMSKNQFYLKKLHDKNNKAGILNDKEVQKTNNLQ